MALNMRAAAHTTASIAGNVLAIQVTWEGGRPFSDWDACYAALYLPLSTDFRKPSSFSSDKAVDLATIGWPCRWEHIGINPDVRQLTCLPGKFHLLFPRAFSSFC